MQLSLVKFKTEFLEILNNQCQTKVTKYYKEEVNYTLFNLFTKYDLTEIQWYLKEKDIYTLEFIPLRVIDKLAMQGILNLTE